MAWLTGWSYRKKITIDETKVDADLVDFPVLVKLTSANFDFSKARSDGYDIRFTSSDGTTLLKYERERHDATNQVAEYWVKVPSVSGTVNTDFYIYYGKSDATDGADPTAVWDANFKAVWHLKESGNGTVGEFKDSTSNANHGQGGGGTSGQIPTQVDAKIDKGQDFDGIDDWIKVPSSASFSITSAITLEAWVMEEDINDVHQEFFHKPNNDTSWASPYGQWRMVTGNQNGTNFNFALHLTIGGTRKELGTSIIYYPNTWYHVVGRYDGSYMKIFVNGTEVASLSVTGSLDTYDTYIRIGDIRVGSVYEPFDGKVDEIRISANARSDAWIKASYNSGNDSLLSYGSEEVAVVGRSYGYIF